MNTQQLTLKPIATLQLHWNWPIGSAKMLVASSRAYKTKLQYKMHLTQISTISSLLQE